ncbi:MULTISPECIES: cobalt-precorrin 5A hydrolase [Psychrilyobacter]|uniref:Cobalt-precorrin 5A hydrolase n=1 Tax=Psychrilyobacter piezotolerans TaxID=2293438 RepID=A0ABX9KIN1_9FUSO|nr:MULTISPECIES: cobalt-precorrin 5A hydrolase [Psychrilyobacter]MCS5421657.1 cobalt-precorrin 5A hydrolase [Psychrilyobacter sp. S5]NDI77225.1 cobalt-precorrin 5A hydrolase [Psychrilyobacter piezotolerans]RDE63284.1 cobalt-precorrin 5A hydrolase [Psychrilyobacter sp. S5]REI41826.1 cobalt-precorrin 5A hydrolase [Psychrilyobacter piezotolerans]
MRLAVITLTKKAMKKGVEIKELLTPTDRFKTIDVFALSKYSDDKTIPMDKGFKDTVSRIFDCYDSLYFIMASGIVVRTIAPLLKSKDVDPAVITSDEDGNFVVSLLSGHLGGANELASLIAENIGGLPVISTASDVSGSIAVDTIAMKLKAHLRNLESAKDLTALIVNGERVELRLPKNMVVSLDSFYPGDQEKNIKKDIAGIVAVSNRLDLKITQIIPRNIILGIGCRRGTPAETISKGIELTMKEFNLHMDSIKHLATVDVKADETGLLEVCEKLGKELIVIDREQIKPVQDNYEGSDFVEKTIGVRCVSAPAAYLSSNKNGKFITEKKIYKGMTVSIYEEE